MPLSFGKLGKAIALLIVVAFVLWLVFTYFFATEEVADEEAERISAIELIAEPAV